MSGENRIFNVICGWISQVGSLVWYLKYSPQHLYIKSAKSSSLRSDNIVHYVSQTGKCQQCLPQQRWKAEEERPAECIGCLFPVKAISDVHFGITALMDPSINRC